MSTEPADSLPVSTLAQHLEELVGKWRTWGDEGKRCANELASWLPLVRAEFDEVREVLDWQLGQTIAAQQRLATLEAEMAQLQQARDAARADAAHGWSEVEHQRSHKEEYQQFLEVAEARATALEAEQAQLQQEKVKQDRTIELLIAENIGLTTFARGLDIPETIENTRKALVKQAFEAVRRAEAAEARATRAEAEVLRWRPVEPPT